MMTMCLCLNMKMILMMMTSTKKSLRLVWFWCSCTLGVRPGLWYFPGAGFYCIGIVDGMMMILVMIVIFMMIMVKKRMVMVVSMVSISTNQPLVEEFDCFQNGFKTAKLGS